MKYLNKIILAGVLAIVAFSCTDPEQPTATNMSYGNWIVDEYYVDGQSDGSGVIQRFILERNDTFVLEDSNGILTTGSWSATDTQLTLSGSGASFTFAIVYQSFDKMHLTQTISSPTLGSITITYLMNKSGDNSTF